MDMQKTEKKWDIKEFAARLKGMLAESLPGYCLEVQEVRKNNGVLLTGIAVREPDSSVSPVLYLEELYARFLDGEPLQALKDAFLNTLQNSKLPEEYETGRLLDFAAVRDRVCLRLVNAAANRESLKDLPHRLFQDLAVTYYVRLWDGSASVTVTRELQRQWGTDEGKLYALALRNTREALGLSVVPLSDAIGRILGQPGESGRGMPDVPDCPLYLAGAASGHDGACAILYEDILEEFSRRISADFYILPSSRHETLFLPARPQPLSCDTGGLLEMVRCVNRTEVAPEDVLSNNIYLYHRLEKRLEMLAG